MAVTVFARSLFIVAHCGVRGGVVGHVEALGFGNQEPIGFGLG
jgi:hypothetical protein